MLEVVDQVGQKATIQDPVWGDDGLISFYLLWHDGERWSMVEVDIGAHRLRSWEPFAQAVAKAGGPRFSFLKEVHRSDGASWRRKPRDPEHLWAVVRRYLETVGARLFKDESLRAWVHEGGGPGG